MATSGQERDFFNGYEAGRVVCLLADVTGAWEELRQQRHLGTTYAIGFRQSIWDYEDANGLPHSMPQRQPA